MTGGLIRNEIWFSICGSDRKFPMRPLSPPSTVKRSVLAMSMRFSYDATGSNPTGACCARPCAHAATPASIPQGARTSAFCP